MGRRRLAQLGLLLASSVLGLVLCELGLRVQEGWLRTDELERAFEHPSLPAPGSHVLLGDIIRPSPDPRIVYELKPGLDVVFQGATLRTNEHGWRDAPHAERKPAGALRIVGIGDSFLFGWGVEVEQRYLDLLGARLRRLHPEHAWQTLAFAAPGYNLMMEMEVLRTYALAYQPDLILYGYVQNDSCLPNFVVAPSSAREPRSLLLERLRGLSGPRSLLVSRDDAVTVDAETADFGTRYCTPANVEKRYRSIVGAKRFHASLVALAALGRELDVPVVMVSHDWRHHFPAERLPSGVLYVDALDAFDRHLSEAGFDDVLRSDLVLSERDPHPSPLAHRILAEVLTEWLEARGVLNRMAQTRGPRP